MLDRRVQQVAPPQEKNEDARHFSEFLLHRNIVLLGDPGSGKTHLFKHFAEQESGLYLTARTFLTRRVDSMQSCDCIYIDALDEKRAGKGDLDTIDEIVTRLETICPKTARISCRAADWLGDTDLAAFSDYFARNGSFVVVSLSQLDEGEQVGILADVGHADPNNFLDEARERGLAALISNPQSLLMLAEVVGAREWPTTRLELYSESLDILVREQNRLHVERFSRSVSPQELLDAAGALCAARLIGDMAGFAISAADATDDVPLASEVSLEPKQHLELVLTRRIFSIGGGVADYSHRTIGEFCAARWIGKKVRQGLPLQRVLALMCARGEPASELRGLFAWLPVFLPEFGEALISADPYGVLTYGDASALSIQARTHLLECLADLGKSDPWFRSSNWSESSVSAISSSEMVEVFRGFLANPSVGFSARSVVLDALAGRPLIEMLPELLSIASDSEAAYWERERSIDALVHLGPAGIDAADEAFKQIGTTADDIRLRAHILTELPQGSKTGGRIATLLIDSLAPSPVDMVGGAFWRLGDRLLAPSAADAMDGLSDAIESSKIGDSSNSGALHEALRVADQLLTTLITSSDPCFGAGDISRWLEARRRLAKPRDRFESERLRDAISGRPELVEFLVEEYLAKPEAAEDWMLTRAFHERLAGSASASTLLEHAVSLLYTDRVVRAQAFSFAMELCVNSVQDQAVFQELWQFAESNPDLVPIRNRVCVQLIPDWKWEQADRLAAASSKLAEASSKRMAEFQRNREEIAEGTHWGWMSWCGDVYMHLFSDVEGNTPHERLQGMLGSEFSAIAINGLKKYSAASPPESVESVVEQHRQGKILRKWSPLLAGFAETVSAPEQILDVDPQVLASMLRIDCHVSMLERDGNSIHYVEPKWKLAAIQVLPEFVCQTYEELALSELRAECAHSTALHRLLNTPELSTFRAAAALRILEQTAVSADQLRTIATHLIADGCSAGLLAMATQQAPSCGENTSTLWLAIGFLLDPNSFRESISTLDHAGAREFFWEVRDLGGGRRRSEGLRDLALDQLEFLITFAIGHFPYKGHPTGGWSGDRNPWDASDYISKLVSAISSIGTADACAALERISALPIVGKYLDSILHACAQQRVLLKDSEFAQPNWRAAVETLRGGSPSNSADMQALIALTIRDLQLLVPSSNTDIFKQFWNEDGRGALLSPKAEESGRDALIELLRARLSQLNLSIEPEGHMANDKRTDVAVSNSSCKLVVEIKRDFNDELWTAPSDQLQRLYARDPNTGGYGIYLVFWYGPKRPRAIPIDEGGVRPTLPADLEAQLNSKLEASLLPRLVAIVLDVSGEIPST